MPSATGCQRSSDTLCPTKKDVFHNQTSGHRSQNSGHTSQKRRGQIPYFCSEAKAHGIISGLSNLSKFRSNLFGEIGPLCPVNERVVSWVQLRQFSRFLRTVQGDLFGMLCRAWGAGRAIGNLLRNMQSQRVTSVQSLAVLVWLRRMPCPLVFDTCRFSALGF